MAPIKRSRKTKNVLVAGKKCESPKQTLAATPAPQNNAVEERAAFGDKTNMATVRALRSGKVYHNSKTDTFVKVSKELFKKGTIESPRAATKKQSSTKALTISRKSSDCFVALEKIDEVKKHRKAVYKDVSPPSAEKQKILTSEKKIMLYDFKGESSDGSPKKRTRKRKPDRRRKKPGDTSDEENNDVRSITKRMKLLAACSPMNQISITESKPKACPSQQMCIQPKQSQTLLSSKYKPLEPLKEQNNTNLSVNNETRKFFKTPVRRELIEMSYLNFTKKRKDKFLKSSKSSVRKKETSLKNCSTKNITHSENTPYNFNTGSKVALNLVNKTKSQMLKEDKNPNIAMVEITKVSLPHKSTTNFKQSCNTKSSLEKVQPQNVANVADKTDIVSPKLNSCVEKVNGELNSHVEVMDGWMEDICSREKPQELAQINCKRGGRNFELNFTLGDSEPEADKKISKPVTVDEVKATLPPTKEVSCSVVSRKQETFLAPVNVVRDKAQNNTALNAPLRSSVFCDGLARKISKRHLRIEGIYVPAAPSVEDFTLENYFGFTEESADEFTMSPVKRQSSTAPPHFALTSTPHVPALLKTTIPQPTRLVVKPKSKARDIANASISSVGGKSNCSQILAFGGYTYKIPTAASNNILKPTFAIPQMLNNHASVANDKQTSALGATKTRGSMLQSSIMNYMKCDKDATSIAEDVNMSESGVPFDTSISNIDEANDELSITHTQPTRRSYERPIRTRRRHIEQEDYISEEEEEPKTNTLSRKYSRSKCTKRTKKEEKLFNKWASNVSSQFEEIDSIALIVE